MTPMKRKGRKTESGILEIKGNIEEQVADMAARAKDQVERKGNWVADKVDKAMQKVEQEAETVKIAIDKKPSK